MTYILTGLLIGLFAGFLFGKRDGQERVQAVFGMAQQMMTLSQTQMDMSQKVMQSANAICMNQNSAIMEMSQRLQAIISEIQMESRMDDLMDEDEDEEEQEARVPVPVKTQAANIRMFRALEDVRHTLAQNEDKIDPVVLRKLTEQAKVGDL